MPRFRVEGYIDVRIHVACEVEVDSEDEATTEGEARFDSREDIHELDEGDVVESQAEKVEAIS